MRPQQLEEALALGRERRNTEFKGPGRGDDKAFRAKIIRAILGMANTPDGGHVIIGVEDDGRTLTPRGLSESELSTWRFDDFQDQLTTFADPNVDADLVIVELHKKKFVVVQVAEFAEIPIICKKDYERTLRRGALYVRRRGKNETIEVPSHVEMREVLDRAAKLVATKMLRSVQKLSPLLRHEPTDDERFAAETKDFLQ